jgi:hypothetical protein
MDEAYNSSARSLMTMDSQEIIGRSTCSCCVKRVELGFFKLKMWLGNALRFEV